MLIVGCEHPSSVQESMLPLFPLSEQHSESLYPSQYSEAFIIQANDSSHIIENIELAVDILGLDGDLDEENMRYYISDRDYSHVFEIILSPRKHEVYLTFLHREGFNKFYQTHLVDAANSDFNILEVIEAELYDGCEDVKDTASFWFENDFGIQFYEYNEELTEEDYLNAGNNRHYNENYSTLEKRTACQKYISHHGGATATNVIGSCFEDREKVNFQPLHPCDATTDFADKDSLRIIRWIDILIERDKIRYKYRYIYWYCARTLRFLFSFSTPYLYLPLAHRVQ
jgi:hypothetical protein